MFDPGEINEKVEKINEAERKRVKIQKKADIKKAMGDREEVLRLKKEGKKIREACCQFHKWAISNHIQTDWKDIKKHWWKKEKKGWKLITQYCGEEYYIDTYVSTYKDLILYKNNKFILATKYWGAQNWVFKIVGDDSELGNFSINELEEKIVDIVQKSGVPYC